MGSGDDGKRAGGRRAVGHGEEEAGDPTRSEEAVAIFFSHRRREWTATTAARKGHIGNWH